MTCNDDLNPWLPGRVYVNPAMRALQDGRVVGLANHTILISRNGTELPIDDSAAPIRDSDGKAFAMRLRT